MSGSLAGAVIDALGLSSSTGPLLAPPPLWSWPPAPLQLVEGSVQTTAGGWDRTTSPKPRVVVAAGPETTLRGVAVTVQGWLSSISMPATPVPDLTTTMRSLIAYNAGALGLAAAVAPGAAVRYPPLPAWRVGALLALPLEWSGAGVPAPVVDVAGLATLANAYDVVWDGVADLAPAPLPFPDASADSADAQSLLTGIASITDVCAPVRGRLLANPSATLTATLALLAAIDAGAAADQQTFATTLVTTTLATDELALLATLTPGAIVLRALYRRLAAAAAGAGATPATAAAISALNGALGVPGTAAADLTQTGPSVVPGEPAASTGWRIRPDTNYHPADANGEPVDGWHELVLGRSIYCGQKISYGGTFAFSGPAFAGTKALKARAALAANLALVNPTNAAGLGARLDVAARIAGNEGGVDAVRLADRALWSVGMQQWSAHHDDELTLLLFKLCAADPDAFDAHFGVYGLGLDPMPDGSGQVPNAVGLTSVPAGGTVTPLAPAPADDSAVATDRLTFLGGYQKGAHHFTFVNPADDTVRTPWAARTRSAARCSRSLILTELLHAASRFDRILSEHQQLTIGTTTLALSSVITSRHGAGQLLDQHINAPGKVGASLNTAAGHAPALTLSGGVPAATWVSAFEALYQHYVAYGSSTLTSQRVGLVDNAGLDATPGSFAAGWANTP